MDGRIIILGLIILIVLLFIFGKIFSDAKECKKSITKLELDNKANDIKILNESFKNFHIDYNGYINYEGELNNRYEVLGNQRRMGITGGYFISYGEFDCLWQAQNLIEKLDLLIKNTPKKVDKSTKST